MNNNTPCPVCDFPQLQDKSDMQIGCDKKRFECYRCGKYLTDNNTIRCLLDNEISLRQRANLSGWIRERQLLLNKTNDTSDFPVINSDNLDELLNLQTPTVDAKSIKLMNYLAKKYPIAGMKFPKIIDNINKIDKAFENNTFSPEYNSQKNSNNFTYHIMSIGWAQDVDELNYLLYDYLSSYKKYLFDDARKITPTGWAFINENPDSQKAFIATKFEPKLKTFQKEWVESAITDAGYDLIRMDDLNHNNIIDDEMILKIKQSKFIVVDFYDNNNGAYYEAGFARGLNKDVICICPENLLNDKKIHFDANHYLFIQYDMNNGKELKKKLFERILATIGEGNYFEKEHN